MTKDEFYKLEPKLDDILIWPLELELSSIDEQESGKTLLARE